MGVRSIAKRFKILVVLLGVALVWLLISQGTAWLEHSVTPNLQGKPPALATHPVYSSYQFGDDHKVFDIGTQPLFLPGVITEVMQRDEILKSQLAVRGVVARFHAFLKGADVNFFLASGDLEAGVGGDMPTLMACANSNVVVTSLIDQHFAAIVARQPLMIPELKGKRIGYAYGSQAHHILLEALAVEGLGPDEINMIPMDVDRMADALHAGSIDAFSAWEPTPALAINKYPEFISIRRALTTGYLYFSRSAAQNSPAITRLVVASQLRAMAWLATSNEHLHTASSWALDAGRELGGDTEQVTASLLASIVRKGLLGISGSAFIIDSVLADGGALFREFQFLQTLGEIPENTNWSDIDSCFNRGLVPEIVSQPELYQLYMKDFPESLDGS